MSIVNEMINDTGDDRSNIQPGDKVVLIVEDDLRFGKILIERAHHENLKAAGSNQLYGSVRFHKSFLTHCHHP
jgi:hypothetical protein